METPEGTLSLPVPPLGYENHTWIAESDGMTSRAALAAGSGPYRSAVVPPISKLSVQLNGTMSADSEEAIAALASFDHYATSKLGAQSTTLGPMSAVLLRTESTSSSQIENLTVGARQLALAELDQSTSDNARVVVANVRAMEAALRLADQLDLDAILTMHAELMSGQRGWEEHAGHLRQQLVWVGRSAVSPRGASFVAPQPGLVAAALADLTDFMHRDDLPVLVQTAIAHAQFETIHPFVDGNGRTGRALVHALLRAKSVLTQTTAPVSAGLLRRTDSYFEALTAYRSGNAAPIVAEFAGAARFAARTGEDLVDSLADQLDAARQRMSSLRRQAAAWKVLPHLVTHPVINAHLVARLLDTSGTTAQRALAQLAETGVLSERSGFKRNRVWQHDGILRVLDDYASTLTRR
ncbi:Fic family protein [Zhihengliuella salsuginis]|uniref:Fic family protein n=1 Tax=Zhihengliuella salsuginis TaxID=578222 RepID=A0ABQ3GGT8_9MICC|nr:Fic family protein [Zhihengliuella salsuginis]GHD05762.1 Fic family protein [Zhihengliuella salsuginis]